MSDPPGRAADGEEAGWPVDLRGVTESVVTTRGPDANWNVAALGLHAGDPVTARTWGNTRTRRNFRREGTGYVQFVRDPVLFVEAALGVREVDDPVLPAADAWVEVAVERRETGEAGGTTWADWDLVPVAAGVERRVVPTVNRGFNAVVEATVAASRLGVPAYDDRRLRRRLAYFERVVETAGGEAERAAMARLDELIDRAR